ncbi:MULTISPECIES: nitroreductase family protein [unclassified Candidatus Frackibacter]|uniref:nitroreductase family protein n=1 Tax=unclassified Candidatus Frackibacter TaxID=2648818 RepID=UPI00087F57BC|nr:MULTISPECIES: nitroreductase family protein [unclassified Candidatus Frackibacter]SDC69040.1 Nitroreductase [Candidatus Frackibacter sp. WG11]SEM82690.1 Nitroreductase [Candidatus Frackibacter sp. WG12]SFL92634.1 Nitroreductase [Candidatus Frackibacter sp. WG13]
MDFLQLAKERYSVREYESKKVEEEKLLKILEAGRVAPTATNSQPQRLIVVQKEEGLNKIKKGAKIYDAPLAIIVCSDHGHTWKRPFDGMNTAHIDASIVTDHMMLQATQLGLGTVWICYFEPEVIKEEFNIPENIEPVNILAIGYAAGEAASPDRHNTDRKPLEETVYYESF